MAQMNHNASYLTTVDGHTVWEKLRVIRGFLKGRKKALKIAELGIEKMREEMEAADKWKKRELEIEIPDLQENCEDCKREIDFLTELEEKLAKLAEPERIEGKTDEEMYELNYFRELSEIHVHRATAEVMSQGMISPQTMMDLLRNRRSMELAVERGVAPKDMLRLKTQQKWLLGGQTVEEI